MNELQIFSNPEFGDIRTVDQNGEPWFVGKDVAAALGYGEGKSLANAVSNHVDEQDKGVTELMTPGGNQKMVIINESGLYSLIFGSKLEGAVRFKRWVTSEVLRKSISRAVISALGGEDTPAYIDNHVRSKVYSECNHDVQDWFRVNSVGNIPRKRFDEAVEYIQRWKPSTNTVMLIQQTNGQTSLFAAAAAQRNTTTSGKLVKEV